MILNAKQQQQEQLHQQHLHQQQQQQQLQQQQMQQQQKPNIRIQEQQQVPLPSPTQLPIQLPNNLLQHRHNAPPLPQVPSRRQDLLSDVLPSAAVGALASGLTPISIFSNLLNAYATLDNKHDITGKS